MTQTALTRSIQQALTQTLRDNRDVVRELLAEVFEDVALTHAIQQGRKTRRVKRASVMKALSRPR